MLGAIVSVVTAILVLAVGLWMLEIYNGLVRLRGLVQASWRQIDIELTRRRELVPGLVKIVLAGAPDAAQAVDEVSRARTAAGVADLPVARRASAEGALSSALGRLYLVAERHPGLRGDAVFASLKAELVETEDRVAAGRRFYNANVRELNLRIDALPFRPFARAFGIGAAEYFAIGDAPSSS